MYASGYNHHGLVWRWYAHAIPHLIQTAHAVTAQLLLPQQSATQQSATTHEFHTATACISNSYTSGGTFMLQ
jgi:hypothetical protein